MDQDRFYAALRDVKFTNIAGEDEEEQYENLSFYIYLLWGDYEDRRWNPLCLDYSINADLRFINEFRKSAVLNELPDEFILSHQDCRTVDDIKDLRAKLLFGMFEDYEDRRWQYYWAQYMLIPTVHKDGYEWDIDYIFADTPDYWQPVPDLKYHVGDIIFKRGMFKTQDWKFDDRWSW